MKILITGSRGMLGKALCNHISDTSSSVNLLAPTRQELDIADETAFKNYIQQHKVQDADKSLNTIDIVYHTAAYVGGVKANSERLATFYSQNAQMGLNVLNACAQSRINKVISVLSTCVYPDTPYVTLPLTETQLHMGPPHPSNFGYAYAKRMLEVHTRTIRTQFNLPYITVIPNNLFGHGDNFHLEDGHIIPALMRRIWEAKLSGASSIIVWGDGSPLREFTYAPDAARILKIVADEYDDDLPLNIGCTEERTIREVVDVLCDALQFSGEIIYDINKPMGQYRKPSSNKRLLELTSWKTSDYTPFNEAIRETCDWFKLNYPHVRGIK